MIATSNIVRVSWSSYTFLALVVVIRGLMSLDRANLNTPREDEPTTLSSGIRRAQESMSYVPRFRVALVGANLQRLNLSFPYLSRLFHFLYRCAMCSIHGAHMLTWHPHKVIPFMASP
jgi:hypothetical protein